MWKKSQPLSRPLSWPLLDEDLVPPGLGTMVVFFGCFIPIWGRFHLIFLWLLKLSVYHQNLLLGGGEIQHFWCSHRMFWGWFCSPMNWRTTYFSDGLVQKLATRSWSFFGLIYCRIQGLVAYFQDQLLPLVLRILFSKATRDLVIGWFGAGSELLNRNGPLYVLG